MRSTPLSLCSLCAATVALLVCAPRVASATSDFPDAIKSHLSLSYSPDCTELCHVGSPMSGTANQPFALAMKKRGLEPSNEVSLFAALDQMRTDAVDSDGDGVTDIDELVAETNPNVAGGGSGGTTDGDQVLRGCGNSSARVAAGDDSGPAWAAGAVVALGLAFARKRR